MASTLEYHLFARFQPGATAVRVAVTLTERAARRLGSELYWSLAYDVSYRVRARNPNTKPYRRPPRARQLDWRSTL